MRRWRDRNRRGTQCFSESDASGRELSGDGAANMADKLMKWGQNAAALLQGQIHHRESLREHADATGSTRSPLAPLDTSDAMLLPQAQ
jgi:hypothetical protein